MPICLTTQVSKVDNKGVMMVLGRNFRSVALGGVCIVSLAVLGCAGRTCCRGWSDGAGQLARFYPGKDAEVLRGLFRMRAGSTSTFYAGVVQDHDRSMLLDVSPFAGGTLLHVEMLHSCEERPSGNPTIARTYHLPISLWEQTDACFRTTGFWKAADEYLPPGVEAFDSGPALLQGSDGDVFHSVFFESSLPERFRVCLRPLAEAVGEDFMARRR